MDEELRSEFVQYKPLYEKYERFYKRSGDLTYELHAGYDRWLDNMSGRQGNQLVPIELDLIKHPEQGIYMSKIDAHDPYPKLLPDWIFEAGVRHTLDRSLGSKNVAALLDQLNDQSFSSKDDRSLVDVLNEYQDAGKNIMIVTSHFTFAELGYIKALMFLAKHDRSRIGQGGIILSKLMTRQSYDDKPVIDHFKKGANLYFSSPVSANAEKFGVPKDAMNLCNTLFLTEYKADLKKGGQQIDAALTGRQVYSFKDSYSNKEYLRIPEVNENSAKLTNNIDGAMVFMAMAYSPITKRWEMHISDAVDMENLTIEDKIREIDFGYASFSKFIEKCIGKETIYYSIVHKLGEQAIKDQF